MSGPKFSIVITAPAGFRACAYLDDWAAELDAHEGEIIVADASETLCDQSRGRIRHLHFPRASLQGLMTAGVAAAAREWVLVTEDHCRPVAGILGHYSSQIENSPSAELIAGAVDNLTSRSPWSFAIFSIGLSEFWRESQVTPTTASNANALVERRAILPDELAVPGGFLNLVVPRLSRGTGFTSCREAVVDHVVHLDRKTVVEFEFQVTKEAIEEYRAIAPAPSLAADLADSLKRLLGCAFIVPLRVARNNKGTSQSRAAAQLRVAFVCLSVALRLGLADARRIAGRMVAMETA